MIDLRSDTVTRPSLAMKQIMLEAPVGDDVFGDDPSINALEAYVSDLFGMEAAVFCPSGTMTNQIAIKINSNAPGELICDQLSHIYKYEGGGIGFNSGLATHLLEGKQGRLTAEQIEAAIQPDDPHFPETQLVSLENTCNKGGGTMYDIEEIRKIRQLCKRRGLKLHLDGARVFNAIVESDYTAQDLGAEFDTISVCLSKGLGAPVGSVLLGTKESIKKARRIRKIFGGGMRQAGSLAAAASFALKNNIERLKEDHARAKTLGETLEKCSFVKDVLPVYTNIVVFEVREDLSHIDVINKLQNKGVRTVAFGPQQIRLVTHLDFTEHHLDQTLTVLQELY
ncbi:MULTISPECIES: low specificity L-threonine aldolase [unclassified Aureispira]|uniref:threonine aldolase family protein n=1 Tax=unclassified Aureispira TaxID=2649989 RepID=UPI00069661D4|nr:MULTISPECIES: GntG family PLP-dependent aldolase [unclassified Aureispira]WMX12686.1 GntG family PLP-dependent aldolase [Aureispira sp. CCB-E]